MGFPAAYSPERQRDADIVEDVLPGQEQVLLLHIADPPGPTGPINPAQFDPTLVRLQQPGDDIEQGALAAAAGAQDGSEFLAVDRQGYIVQGFQFLHGFTDPGDFDCRHRCSPYSGKNWLVKAFWVSMFLSISWLLNIKSA